MENLGQQVYTVEEIRQALALAEKSCDRVLSMYSRKDKMMAKSTVDSFEQVFVAALNRKNPFGGR